MPAPSSSVSERPRRCSSPIGKDMAALEVAGQLHLVDGDELRLGLPRHGFHRADRIARHVRADLFLAGHKRDIVQADPLHQPGIDLACQEAKRQSDDAGAVGHHALDRVMRLAGVGGTEDRGYPAAAQDHRLIEHSLDLACIWPALTARIRTQMTMLLPEDKSGGARKRRGGCPAALRTQTKNCPPLADRVEPVMKPASSEARNTTQRAISSGSPSRPTGICGMIRSVRTFSGIARTISVPI